MATPTEAYWRHRALEAEKLIEDLQTESDDPEPIDPSLDVAELIAELARLRDFETSTRVALGAVRESRAEVLRRMASFRRGSISFDHAKAIESLNAERETTSEPLDRVVARLRVSSTLLDRVHLALKAAGYEVQGHADAADKCERVLRDLTASRDRLAPIEEALTKAAPSVLRKTQTHMLVTLIEQLGRDSQTLSRLTKQSGPLFQLGAELERRGVDTLALGTVFQYEGRLLEVKRAPEPSESTVLCYVWQRYVADTRRGYETYSVDRHAMVQPIAQVLYDAATGRLLPRFGGALLNG